MKAYVLEFDAVLCMADARHPTMTPIMTFTC